MARISLFPDFRELLESLNSAKVKYLVLGGYAVNFYGYHRSTNDLDIWIAADPKNAIRVSAALQEFGGYAPADVDPRNFRSKGQMFILGREPFRVDIITNPSGVDFDECYKRRLLTKWDGVSVPVISFQDLKFNKRHSGRAKDLADLENLPKAWRPPKPRTKRPKRKPPRKT